MPPTLDVAPILQTAFSFWSSKVLLTAVELGLFTRLGTRKLTAQELGRELELHPRGTFDFFDALVAMGFLGRDGDGPAGKYHNTETGLLYLDQKSPRYVGGILVMLNARLFRFWNDLPTALAHREAAERDQARPEGDVRGALCRAAASGTVHGRDDRPLAHQLRGLRREVRLQAFPDPVRRRRRDRAARDRGGEAPSAPRLHVLRPAGGRADREEVDRGGGSHRAT